MNAALLTGQLSLSSIRAHHRQINAAVLLLHNHQRKHGPTGKLHMYYLQTNLSIGVGFQGFGDFLAAATEALGILKGVLETNPLSNGYDGMNGAINRA